MALIECDERRQYEAGVRVFSKPRNAVKFRAKQGDSR
jgi:hypothetical protein